MDRTSNLSTRWHETRNTLWQSNGEAKYISRESKQGVTFVGMGGYNEFSTGGA